MQSRYLQRLAIGFGLFAAAAAIAAGDAIEGRVVGKDVATNTIIVDTETGQHLTFTTAPTTTLQRRNGEALTLSNVEVGDRVEITSDALHAATPVATRVVVLVPVVPGITVAPGTDRVNDQTDNTGKASGYRPSQQKSPDDE
jgi:hypothetical protein